MSWWWSGLGRTRGSGFWLQLQESEGFRLERIRFGELLEGRTGRIGHELMGVATAARQMRQQRGEAVRRHSTSGLFRLLFFQCRGGGLGRLDRVALSAVLLHLFVGEQERLEC